ncbi:hypothetical protein D9757_001941 [Collybiopsis confluens]|uniref:tRNA-splicing endonuclease subunit Sen34 n=1 Tax=Collybiopsis confluens TaxID=2823264 RepID=A0A8H5MEB1_9AGAR|nr:hypothetical protein D9757_001941 [Collybiopsis confluens]
MKDRIPIRIANKRAYVWDVDDLVRIRSEHHLCGLLVGTLPHLSQQNVFLGVPAQLIPEEAMLLVEQQLAVFIDDPNAYPEPSLSQFERWNEQQIQYLKRQKTILESDLKPPQLAQRAMSEEAIQKRKQRELKRQQKAQELRQNVEQPIFVPSVEDPERSSVSSSQYTISVSAPSSSLSWYTPSSHSYSTIEAARQGGIWDFPSDLRDRARYGVFKDLWEQGYFMGGGIRFGAIIWCTQVILSDTTRIFVRLSSNHRPMQ